MTNRIKEFRQEIGITQEELASCVNSRRETIVYLEKGKYNPSLRLAYNIAKRLGKTIEDIFSFEDENST
jgi:putative transcriptional regulator